MEKEPTTRDILEAINTFATHMEERWREGELRWKKSQEEWSKTEEKRIKTDVRVSKQEAAIDALISGMLDMQEWRREMNGRLDRIEALMEKTFQQLGAFTQTLHRHEEDVVSLRSGYQRIEKHLSL